MSSVFDCFAVSPPGLESLTAQELSSLGLVPKILPGGVSFQGGLKEIYLTNLYLRTASRILLKVGSFKALHFEELVQRVARYPWEIYLSQADRVRLRVTCRRSKLYHSKAVAERVLKGLSLRLGRKIELAQEEAPLLIVRLWRDEVLLRIDTSGADLFKRGYKVASGPAPLRENLAAALIYLARWDGQTPFLDPFCGTGTIPIEAALMAAHIPPGWWRSFAFQEWKNFKASLWEELREEARKHFRVPKVEIWANDISPKAVKAARENSKAAGVEDFLRFSQEDVALLEPPAHRGLIVTNPPYGERLQRKAYQKFALFLKKHFPRWQALFLSPNKKPLKEFSLKTLARFEHGGLRVYALQVV